MLDFKRVRVEAGTETATGNTDWNKVQCRKSSVKGGTPARDGRWTCQGQANFDNRNSRSSVLPLFSKGNYHPKSKVEISIYLTCILCINTSVHRFCNKGLSYHLSILSLKYALHVLWVCSQILFHSKTDGMQLERLLSWHSVSKPTPLNADKQLVMIKQQKCESLCGYRPTIRK